MTSPLQGMRALNILNVPLVLKMAIQVAQGDYNYFEVDDEEDDGTLSSAESEDVEHPVDRIIAEFTCKDNHLWYLVKWLDCPLIRSTWERVTIFSQIPRAVIDTWNTEKQKQAEGKSQPLDIAAFQKAVLDAEVADRQRRRLKSFKKQALYLIRNITES